jgi:short-subunit dehydrogenase
VNLCGVINVTRAALPHMRRQRAGHIVQMSSLNGIEPLSGGAYYTASKFAIEGFSESLAGEVAHLGIKVTIVESAPARTRFLNDKSAQASERRDAFRQQECAGHPELESGSRQNVRRAGGARDPHPGPKVYNCSPT